MSLFKKKSENVDISKQLLNQIEQLIHNTPFCLSKFEFNPHSFKEPLIELTNEKMVVRFIYDRGDIYQDKRPIDSEQWLDEQLVFSHNEPSNGIYESLLKAIDSFVKQ